MRRKLSVLRGMRSVLTNTLGKYNNRTITDCTMVSSLANDKGTLVVNNGKSKKRSLSLSKGTQVKRTGTRKK